MYRKQIIYCISIGVLLTLSACSTRKNQFHTRNYHKMTSWFNTLFNGQEAMDRKLTELEAAYKDDYFQILRVEPYEEFKENLEAENQVQAMTQPKGGFFGKALKGNLLNTEESDKTGFEKAEEKALKAINNHSMVIKNEERNKLMARAYLMLGQARYYQGKPFQAMEALQHLDRMPFDKHKNKAKYYLGLAQIQAGNHNVAVEIFEDLMKDEELKKRLKDDIAKHYAAIYIENQDYEKAIEMLDVAIENSKDRSDKARFHYIEGQLLSRLGKNQEAIQKFEKSYKLKPSFEMEARSQVAMALNFEPTENRYSDFEKRLEKVMKIGTYEKYKNEFLYALGQVSERIDSIGLAERYYKKALLEEMSEPQFRAETYAALGKIKFDKSDYVYAGAYYDSAVQVQPENKRKEELTAFRDGLKKVIEKHYLVQRNDSVLALAALPQAEQEKFFTTYIEDLKKQDELRQKEEEEAASDFKTESKIKSFDSSFDDKGTFYFYSNSAKSNGENEFKRLWGNVRLKDNWRNSIGGSTIEDQKAELTGTADLNNPRRYDLSFYMEQIPSGSELDRLKMERDTTELSLGIDYYDNFKDRKLSTRTLEHLLSTPPRQEEVKVKAVYNLYRANNGKNVVLAEKYKNLILENYPNTIYAESILNPNQDLTTSSSPEALALYDQAYAAYQNQEYEAVQQYMLEASAQYTTEKIMPKFMLLYAQSEGALNGKKAYIAALKRVVVMYKDSEEGKYAQSIIDRLNGKKKAVKAKKANASKTSKSQKTRENIDKETNMFKEKNKRESKK